MKPAPAMMGEPGRGSGTVDATPAAARPAATTPGTLPVRTSSPDAPSPRKARDLTTLQCRRFLSGAREIASRGSSGNPHPAADENAFSTATLSWQESTSPGFSPVDPLSSEQLHETVPSDCTTQSRAYECPFTVLSQEHDVSDPEHEIAGPPSAGPPPPPHDDPPPLGGVAPLELPEPPVPVAVAEPAACEKQRRAPLLRVWQHSSGWTESGLHPTGQTPQRLAEPPS